MKPRLLVTIWTVVLCFQSTSALNILFFFPISTYSHRIPVWPLVEGLANKGHNVTFVSPYPPKQPNPKVTEFAPKEMVEFVQDNEEGPKAVIMRQNKEIDPSWWVLPDWGSELCELFLTSPDTQEWLKASKFDLIVIDALFNDCGLGLAHYFQAKHMVYATTAPFMWHYDTFGIPHEASWIPDMQWHYSEQMTFMERFWTTWNTILWDWERQYNYFPKLHRILSAGLNASDLPPLRDIEQNVSLVLMNSHFSEEFPRALPPLVVPVGGMHIKESKKNLPKNFEDFIAKSDEGFIYISFGSAVQLSKAPKEISSAFFDAVRRIKHLNFIWKWDDEVPEDIPPNVLMQKWMPQQEILAHKKIKGFVTHGGLMSMQEAIYHGVPLISMPVFAEQDYNAERVHNRGMGIRLEITTITADKLVDAISKLTNDQRYKLKMAEVSKKFRDRPLKAVESAMWWTEYILRHEDTSHLRPKSIYQNWFIRRLLDVYLVSFVILLAAVTICYKTVTILLSFCLAKATPTQKRKQN